MSDVPANNPINITDLDVEFPVPGQDNDSQGFRDNFTVINTNNNAVKARLEDIETNIVRKDEDVTFVQSSTNTVTIANPNVKALTKTKKNITTGTEIDFADGDYHTISLSSSNTTANTATFDITGYAYAGPYQKVILEISSDASYTIAWNSSVSIKFSESSFWSTPVTNSAKVHIFEIWTTNGSVYFADYIGAYA